MQGGQGGIVILSGTDLLLDWLYFDDEVERRFKKIQMPTIIDATEGDTLRGVIAQFCEIVYVDCPTEVDLVPRLIHGCRGRIGMCIEKSIEAIELALTEGAEGLSTRHYAEAWDGSDARSDEQNVFVNPKWASVDLNRRRTPKTGKLAQ